MDDKKDLVDKLKTLSYDELVGYERAAVILGRLVGFFGICLILLTMSFPGVLTIISCTILIFLLANINVGVDESLELIRGAMEKKGTRG